MTDFSPSEIIARFGGPTSLAKRLGIPPSTVANWPARNRIPGEYWPTIMGLLSEANADESGADASAVEMATNRK